MTKSRMQIWAIYIGVVHDLLRFYIRDFFARLQIPDFYNNEHTIAIANTYVCTL